MRWSIIILSWLLSVTTSHASSPQAWEAFDKRVAKACAAASGLRQPHVSKVVGFDDTLGKVATLVTGIYPQKAMKGANGAMLCLYDKATGKTWIDEAKGWTARDRM